MSRVCYNTAAGYQENTYQEHNIQDGYKSSYYDVLDHNAVHLVFSLHSWRKDAQLPEQAQVVYVLPGFDDLAIDDAIGDGSRIRHRFAGGRQAPPRPLVRAAIGVA